ncbi:MAG: PKD domain-containing protein [Ginsengibacter sp.]
MKHILFAFLFYSFLLASCKKEITKLQAPQASFSFRGDSTDLFTMVTNDTCTLINNSVNADSSFWDLGNGDFSKKKNVVLSYSTHGTYNIKLTVTNSAGQRTSVIKTVKVVDRVLRKIIINKVYWDTIPNHIPYFNYNWPTSSTADVYVQIQQYREGDSTAPYSLLPESPILYKSPVINNLYCNTSTPVVINVPGRIVVDKNMILNGTFRVFLLAKDSNNVVYNLQSTFESGVSFGIREENLQKNKFILFFSLTSSVEFDCDFE